MIFNFIDVETTGLDYKKNGVIQIAGMIVEYFPNGESTIFEKYDLKCAPFEGDEVEDKALEVNKTSLIDINNYPEPDKAYLNLKKIWCEHVGNRPNNEKMYFVGYNAYFDYKMMEEFFKKNNDDYFYSFFYFPVIDVAALAALKLMNVRHTMPNFKLETVAKVFEVHNEGAHDALIDIKMTKDIYDVIMKGKNNVV